ncbi:MAG: adenosylcobinamide-GDP ribazoletransferase [Bryobacteraceae bacterium]
MRSLLAAIAFLTRIPVGRWIDFGREDVARSAAWFPAVGALVGGIQCLAAWLLRPHLPAAVTAVSLVALDVLLTGALHYDGLADSADGFGGGKDRDDILRIMRDHCIGSYGGVALVLTAGMKIATLAALVGGSDWPRALIAAPLLGRWAILLLSAALPYARATASVVVGMGRKALGWGTLLTALALAAGRDPRLWVAAAVVLLVAALLGLHCRRKIGGITGDTLGAAAELGEIAVLLVFLWHAG